MGTMIRVLNVAKNPVFIIFYLLLLVLCWNYVDLALAARVDSWHLHKWMAAIKIIGVAGKWYLSIAICFIIYFWYLWKKQTDCARRAAFVGVCIFLPNVIALLLKVLLARARPEMYFQIDHFGFYFVQFNHDYWSFPSGHTTTATALMVSISLLYPRWLYPLFVLVLLVMASRILSGMHYLSDVLAGAGLSLIVLAFCKNIIARHTLKQEF